MNNRLFSLFIALIVTVSVVTRLTNFRERVSVVADNSREAQVTTYAARNLKIPQIGQFSSAGPFFYIPWWYWILELVAFLPFGFLTQWYFAAFLSFAFIFLIYLLGKEVSGKWFGATCALFASVSQGQIENAYTLWNPVTVPLLGLLSLIFLVKFYKTKKLIYFFLIPLNTVMAATIHFQNILILPILIMAIATLIASRFPAKRLIRYLLVFLVGAVIPLLPLIYFDLNHHWYESKSILIYLLVDQYKIWVPNRWLIYLGTYWPQAWAYIIGGNRTLSILIIALIALFSFLKVKTWRQQKIFFILLLTFLSEIFLYRYYRGERFVYYSFFAHPLVLLLTSWAVFELFKLQKFLGFLLVAAIAVSSLSKLTTSLKAPNLTLSKIESLKQTIYAAFPSNNFDVYACAYNGNRVSHPLALSIYFDNRNNSGGTKVGVCELPSGKLSYTLLSGQDAEIKSSWENVTTQNVYENTVEWWKTNPPKGGDHFWRFLKENLLKKS